jgi:hypothetical protein
MHRGSLCFTQNVQTLTHSCFCPHLAPIRRAPNSQRTPIMESFFPQSKFPEICNLITLSHTICPNCQRTLVSQSHSAPYHRIINQQMMLGDRSLTHHWQISWIFFSPSLFCPQHKAVPLFCSVFLCKCHHLPPPTPTPPPQNFISFFIAIEQVTLGTMSAVQKVMAA